jgi:hypothetical protein
MKMPVKKVEEIEENGKKFKKTTYESGATVKTEIVKNPDKGKSKNIEYLEKIMDHLGISY